MMASGIKTFENLSLKVQSKMSKTFKHFKLNSETSRIERLKEIN